MQLRHRNPLVVDHTSVIFVSDTQNLEILKEQSPHQRHPRTRVLNQPQLAMTQSMRENT